jgi:hypothetical protein
VYANGIARLALPDPSRTEVSAVFRVWDGGRMSSRIPGVPLAWSANGDLLAVLLPASQTPAALPSSGRLAIERPDGTIVRELSHTWVDSMTASGLAFSADDQYLAACVSVEGASEWPACSVSVVDIGSGSVSSVAPGGSIFTWLPDDALLVSGLGTNPSKWDHGHAAAGVGPADTVASASAKGAIAFEWGDGRQTIQLRTDGVDRTVTLSAATGLDPYGPVWAPDGSSLAVVVVDASGGRTIEIVPAR